MTSCIIGFERGTLYQEPPPTDVWRIGPAGEESYLLHESMVVPGIEGDDWEGNPCPVMLRKGCAWSEWPLVQAIVRRHAMRICPWGVLWFASEIDGISGYAGMAWPQAEQAVVRAFHTAPFTLDSAWHEIWHLLEQWVDADLLDRLDAGLAKGPAYSFDALTRRNYLSLPCERRARAFAHLGMLHVEGAAPPGHEFGDTPWSILARAWSGRLGEQAAERREAARRSEERRLATRIQTAGRRYGKVF